MLRRLTRFLLLAASLLLMVLLAVALHAAAHGRRVAESPPGRPADMVLVLGNRAWIDGEPNPCLVSRVGFGVSLANAGLAPAMLMSGGTDHEDGRIEADEMAAFAAKAGYGGPVLREGASQSTRENLLNSRAILKQAGAKRVIVVSEPAHMWRVRKLAREAGFEGEFDVQYAAVPQPCARSTMRKLRAALREPLAILDNAWHGYL